jgi:hypothetical protein
VMEDKKYIFINIYLFVCLYMTVDWCIKFESETG